MDGLNELFLFMYSKVSLILLQILQIAIDCGRFEEKVLSDVTILWLMLSLHFCNSSPSYQLLAINPLFLSFYAKMRH